MKARKSEAMAIASESVTGFPSLASTIVAFVVLHGGEL